MSSSNNSIQRARSLRISETKSEKLLWSMLRARQLSNLKFRRQYPIPPFYADFACVSHMLIVEIDGGYHDYVPDSDYKRELHLRHLGWRFVRFTDQEVLVDVEAVGLAITQYLGIEYCFMKRGGSGSGMMR